MEHRPAPRVKARLEVVWSAHGLDGVGILRNLSRSGVWIDRVRVQPAVGEEIRVVILEGDRDRTFVEGGVVRRNSSGFAVHFDSETREVGLLVDRLEAAARLGQLVLPG